MRKVYERVVLFLLTALLIGAVYLVSLYTYTYDLGSRTVTIIVKPGDSFNSVADRLIARDIVYSKTMLKLAARLRGIDTRLIPGRYDFTGRNSYRTVLNRLAAGDFLRVRVTVPEGSPIWKVASIVADALDLDSATFVGLNHNPVVLGTWGLRSLEGYLFPETYIFPWGVSEIDVAEAMVAQFQKRTRGIWPIKRPLDLTSHEIITLASIIEAETKLDEERPVVASVYLNRLRNNMKLDADPTVIYGLGGLDRPLYRKDLRTNSPYNTYRHRGLPPTPINSPGTAAIEAALNPANTDFYYFVADQAGGHTFSRTLAEHNRARRRIREVQQQTN